jgi:glutamate synthase (NADPH/NADH) small chain
MAKANGYLLYNRKNPLKLPVEDRIKNFKEFENLLPEHMIREQAARCMDCGIPFCHNFGCPVYNYIPDWNHMVYLGKWKEASDLLHSTNNFPEFTGKVCPAPCEKSCTLANNWEAVTIKHIELQIVEKAWENGWIKPIINKNKTNKKVAVIGSGPAGLAAAQQLARMGHNVVVFERSEKAGGLLRYGIPDFKLDKNYIDRRLEQMVAEGVSFETQVNVGVDISTNYLMRSFDAILFATGTAVARDLKIPGRYAKGVYFALDFLGQQNRINHGAIIPVDELISAKDKDVIVIGGGDTGADCVGTSIRQGAKSVTQVEILPQPPLERRPDNPWPFWPQTLSNSTSHEEGCKRLWSLSAKEFIVENNAVKGVKFVELEWTDDRKSFKEVPNSEKIYNADLVLLAMGFLHCQHDTYVKELNLELDQRGNIKVNDYRTSVNKVFATGDTITGASLVVRAIYHGRQAADKINLFLK